MGVIDDIEQLIRGNVAAGAAPLRGTPLDAADHATLLHGVLDPRMLMLQVPEVQRTNDSVRVTGKAALFDRDGLDVDLGFEVLGEDCRFVARANLPDLPALAVLASAIEVPQLVWSVGPLGQDGDGTALAAVARFHFSTALKLGGIRLPIGVHPGIGEDAQWQVEGSGLDVPLPDLGPVFQWLGIADAASLLPSPLRSLGGFTVTDVSLAFRPQQATLTQARIGLACGAAWKLANGRIAVENLTLSFGYETDATSGERTIVGLVQGRLRVGDQSLAVRIGYDTHTRTARLELIPGAGVTLPSLQPLADFAGAPLSGLPAQLTGLTALRLTGFTVDVDTEHLTLERVSAGFAAGQRIALGQTSGIESLAFFLTVSPGAGDAAVSGWINALVTVADTTVSVHGLLQRELSLTGTLPSLDLAALAAALIPDLPPALTEAKLKLSDIEVTVTTAGRLGFQAAADFDFHALAAALKIPLPDGLASIRLDRIALDLDVRAGTWSVALATPLSIRFPHGCEQYLQVSDIRIEIMRPAGSGVTTACDFTIGGALPIAPDLRIDSAGLACSWHTGADRRWTVHGTVDVTVFGSRHSFDPVIEIEGERSRFGLRYGKTLPLVSWAGTAAVEAANLILGVERSGDTSGYIWSFSGDTRFDIGEQLVSAAGRLSLKGRELDVSADIAKPVKIVLPLPSSPSIEIAFQPLRLRMGGADHKGPAIEAGAAVTVRNVPAPADKVFPGTPMEGSLRVDERTFSVSFKPPAGFAIDAAFARGTPMEVRFPQIDIHTFHLDRLRAGGQGTAKTSWRLAADLTIGQLGQLNRLFGGADLFAEAVDLTLSLASGLSMTARSSPLKPLELRPPREDGTVWTQWLQIADAGTFSFRVPEFAFDFKGGRWRAAGGVERKGDLAIPLGAIKRLLAKGGLATGFLAAMPNAIPLIQLDLRSPRFYDDLARMIGHLSPGAAAAFKRVAQLLQTAIARLPERLAEYFEFSVPELFSFDLTVEPSGGYSFAIGTAGDKPVRVLLPAVLGPIPELLGLTLYNVSFGLTGGGSLARVKVDGWIDRTDLINLGYALATGQGQALTNRIILRNTTALVPIATGTPVPIPLFYDQIGWEYLDAFGIGLQLHARFKDPEPSLLDWLALLQGLLAFFRQPDYYLHEKGLPPGMQLDFSLGATSIRLPSYLGGATLGPETGLPALSVSDTLARALDGIKTGNAGWLIQSVPLKWPESGNSVWIRVGRETIAFGPLEISAGWCIATEQEFRDQVLASAEARKALAVANADAMLECLPRTYGGKAYEKGFVILLMGELAAKTGLADIFAFRCQFGTAMMGPHDFETAVRLQGRFGPKEALELGIEGRIRVEAPEDGTGAATIKVGGSTYLVVAGTRLGLAGEVVVSPGRSFEATVSMTLSDAIRIAGTLTVDGNGAGIEGHVVWSGLGTSSGSFATGVAFSRGGVLFRPFELQLGEFGCRASLQLPGTKAGELFTMGVAIDLPPQFSDNFKAGLKTTAKAVVTDKVSKAYSDLEAAIARVDSLQADLTGLQAWLPPLCKDISARIKAATTKKSVHSALDAWANQPANWVTRQARKTIIAGVKKAGPEDRARDSAAPWIAKLAAVQAAASRPLDENYRARLQQSLRDLLKSNTIEVWVGGIPSLKFPGLRVYRMSPVLNKGQIALINKAIAAIKDLPAANGARVKTADLIGRLPEKERVMEQIRRDIDRGIDAGIPGIRSVGFETSAGPVELTRLTISVAFTYGGKPPMQRDVTVDLTRPDRTAKALADAFAGAF